MTASVTVRSVSRAASHRHRLRSRSRSLFVLAAACLCWSSCPAAVSADVSASSLSTSSDDQASMLDTAVRRNRLNDNPTYVVLAPRLVRPGSVYRVLVDVRHIGRPVDVRGALVRDNVQLASATASVTPLHASTLLLQVPASITPGSYSLRVEGNYAGTTGGTLFSNETRVHYHARFLTILTQLNRPIYNGQQTVRFRVVLLDYRLRPYDEPIDVFILDPDGFVVRRWTSRAPVNGIVSLSYRLPLLAKLGSWAVRARARGQTHSKTFPVELHYVPRFEVDVDMSPYILTSDQFIEGTVSARFSRLKKPVSGNLTVRVLYRHRDDVALNRSFSVSQLSFVTWMHGVYKFRLPMSRLTASGARSLDGGEVRVQAQLTEFFEAVSQHGFCVSRLVNSSVHVQFIGAQPVVYKPGMPLTAVVSVSYYNGEPLSEQRLRASSLHITSASSGGGVSLGRDTNQALLTVPAQHTPSPNTGRYWTHSTAPGPGVWDSGQLSDGHADAANVTVHQLVLERVFAEYRRTGLYRFTVQAPSTAGGGRRAEDSLTASEPRRLVLTARYRDHTGETASASLTMISYHSSRARFVSVRTSTQTAKLGEYVVLHVRANFYMNSFNYLVVSKGLLLFADEALLDEATGAASLRTISVPVGAEMAPLFRVFVYHVTDDGELLSDSIVLPVDAIGHANVGLQLNQHKDRLKSTVEAVCRSPAGSVFSLSALRRPGHDMASRSQLNLASVQRALHSFETHTRSVHSVRRSYSGGVRAPTVHYFSSSDYGVDTAGTVYLSQLLVLTDARVAQLRSALGRVPCNSSAGQMSCAVTGCYDATQRCDRVQHCLIDGSDELDCPRPPAKPSSSSAARGGVSEDYDYQDYEDDSDDEYQFRLTRKNHQRTLYNQRQGDWAWRDVFIGHRGVEELVLKVPHQDAVYYVTGFSVSQSHGFGIIEQPVLYNTTRPLHLRVEMTPRCRRGEQVSVRASVANNQPLQQLVLLQLADSRQYRMVHVQAGGQVAHYAPQTSAGAHQHLVPMAPFSTTQVDFPLALLAQVGVVNVTLSVHSQVGFQRVTKQLLIEPEGVTISRHTSLLLDLKSRGLEYKFIDLMLDKSPLVAYSAVRRYVYGSPMAHLTITGDVVGPIFPDGIHQAVTARRMLGRPLRSAETLAYQLGINVWSLHYLRLTQQLPLARMRSVFRRLNVDLAAVLYFQRADGAFSMWRTSAPSVWLTSWITRVLMDAREQYWEDELFVEPRVVWRAVAWLLKHQNLKTGAFYETANFSSAPLDTKLTPPLFIRDEVNDTRNVSLTAQVLIALSATIESLRGDLRASASIAKLRATSYLERQLFSLKSPYDLAVVTYALTMANSGEAGFAFDRLQDVKRDHDKLVYWSPAKILPNSLSNEISQRDLLQPKIEQLFDSRAVEATAYALLVYIRRDGSSEDQEKMVLWLNTMRMSDGAFVSSTDSLMAVRALTHYSYQARLRDITDMTVDLKWSSAAASSAQQPHLLQPSLHHHRHHQQQQQSVVINNRTLERTNRFDIDGVWGHVRLTGRGSGQAVAQLHIEYGVDALARLRRPPQPSFSLSVRERFLPFRNKSVGVVDVCARWLFDEEGGQSGAAVLQVDMPSGYVLFQPDADAVVQQAQFTEAAALKHAIGSTVYHYEPAAVWFFDSVPGDRDICFNYTIRRWFAVANMTQFRRALLYEQFQPEHFEVQMVNSTALYVLNVCDVCGSYQCPYCPFYSAAPTAIAAPSIHVVLLLSTLAVIVAFIGHR